MKKNGGKMSVQVENTRYSVNKGKNGKGKYRSVTTTKSKVTDDDSVSYQIRQNREKGTKGRYTSATVSQKNDGSIAGNFERSSGGKYIEGPRAVKKFSRMSNRMTKRMYGKDR